VGLQEGGTDWFRTISEGLRHGGVGGADVIQCVVNKLCDAL
jgi:hypothetical protein